LWKQAEAIAKGYSVVVRPEPDLGFFGRGVEFSGAMGDGPTEEQCIRHTREALTLIVAVMLEEGGVPPSPASEDKREEQINVRVTKFEKLVLDEAARSRGYRGISDYMRAAALSGVK
jgi:predicted RNase H-like HicB family nuclease